MRIFRRWTLPATTFAAVFGLLTTPGATPAQEGKGGEAVFAFLSSSAEFKLTGDPKGEPTYLQSLSTRLNTENQVFAYVHNPSARAQVVDVRLQAGDDKSRVELGRTAESVSLNGGETKRVTLSPAKAPLPAPPVAPPAVAPAAGKEAVKEVPKPRGEKLPANARLFLRVVPKTVAEDKFKVLGTEPGSDFDIVSKAPVGFTCEVKTFDRTVTATVSYSATAKRLSNAPVKVRLDLRPDLNPGLNPASLLKGTFEAELPALDEKDPTATATLVAEGVEFNANAQTKATVAVTIDGYDRAFLFETAFDGTKPAETGTVEKPIMNARLSASAQTPGKPVTIAVEADGVAAGRPVELLVDRVGDGKKFELLRKFPTDRSREVFLFVGEDGAVALTPVVKDWTVEFPTAQVAGKRAFAVGVGGTTSTPQVLVVDRTPPAGVAIVTKPTRDQLLVGKLLNLSAVGTDPESGIDRVYFFTGETPPALGGKPAPGSRVIPGQLGKALLASTYSTAEAFRLPEQKGELRVGVVFFNKVGLATVADSTLYVRTPVPVEKPTTGSIVGRAVQAGRPQPGLPVALANALGKVVKETKTDDLGKFEFKELPPGSYTVVAVKRADANASGKATVEVKADKDPTQIKELVIKR